MTHTTVAEWPQCCIFIIVMYTDLLLSTDHAIFIPIKNK